ncbi:signal transduction histidine-protein kinase BaeS [Salmonella enterica subsp. enterica serovar Montevideo str. CT_02035278]|nr:signal transduction histidine-protein kinase BaeS [Salmonella enterica subsp. enterica serovar Montevideo str. CT_02035278]
MKVWRPGITGKLFLAIFATCIVLLISMHWAVRVSFERGFIDYIKHGNEQRLQMLGDALGDQYQQHGNWRFLRNNDRFVFQILRSFEHDNDRDKPGPGMPPHGWRTQFWVVDQMAGCWSAHAVRCRMTVLAAPFWSMASKSARLSPRLSSG